MNSSGGRTTIRFIGFQSEHIEYLKKQLQGNGPHLVLDLEEVTLAVRHSRWTNSNGLRNRRSTIESASTVHSA
jgi:hypothetical protein